MKALLTLALLLAVAVPALAAPAPAAVDAAAREQTHDRWQRAVTHAKRLHDAVTKEAATRDYADDMPATGFSGTPARRKLKGASLRRAPAAFQAEPDLRDAPNSAKPATLPAAEPLPGLDASLVMAVKPGLPARAPSGPIPAAQRAPDTMPTLDQAMDPLVQADAAAITPGQTAASCPAPRPGAKRALRPGCNAPRGI